MKRITFWPQAYLGVAINAGAVVSWLAVVDKPDYTLPVLLMLSMWSWTILYGQFLFLITSPLCLTSTTDTVYACQDKKDDVRAGVRSTAILFGQWIRPLLVAFGLLFVGALAYAGIINQQGPAFFGLSVGGALVHLVWQYLTVDLEDPKSCKGTHSIPDSAANIHHCLSQLPAEWPAGLDCDEWPACRFSSTGLTSLSELLDMTIGFVM
jgi:4-hydroxybenzoate polyprenyltransferase